MHLLTLKTVLAATDLDEAAVPVLQTARALSAASGAALHVVHISDSPNAEHEVGELLNRVDVTPIDATVHIFGGDPASMIGRLADHVGADVILLAAHRQRREGTPTGALGSTAMALVTRGSAPCLVVGRPLPIPLRRVVVGVDMSDAARGALIVGLSWTSALRDKGAHATRGTTLTALHVRSSEESGVETPEQELARIRADAGEWAGVTIEKAGIDDADPARGIARYAAEHHADLTVLGTEGLRPSTPGHLGSVSAAVLQQLDAPVLLVPPSVWRAYAAGAV